MVRPVAGDLPEQVKNNQSVNMAAGNGGQKMSQYPWFTVYDNKLREELKAVERLRKAADQLARQKQDKSHDRGPEL